MREWNKNNPEKVQASRRKKYLKNKEKILAKNKEWRVENKEYKAKKDKEYQLNNKEKISLNNKNRYEKDKERIVKKVTAYKKERLKTDTLFKLKCNLRGRIGVCLKENKFVKTQNTEKILGADMITVKNHIESQFKNGMEWSNYGLYGWHLDHIVPLASAKTEEEVYNLCHYTNLQPLWAFENLSKGCRIA